MVQVGKMPPSRKNGDPKPIADLVAAVDVGIHEGVSAERNW
jgi:hypothetical protein